MKMKRTEVLQWVGLIVISFTVGVSESSSSCEPQIMPYPTTVVTESDSVTITCSYNETGLIRRIIWFKNNIPFITLRDDCTQVGSISNSSQYDYQCISGTIFTWTILHVSEDQHDDQWSCVIYEEGCAAYYKSRQSTIYVEVPVQSVTFNSPSGTLINIIENEQTEFTCITSEERPRSTILWFIGDNSTALSGSSTSPVNNDTRTRTTGQLQYRFTRESNGKQLFCSAENSHFGPKLSEKKELNVLYPPSIPEIRYSGTTILGALHVILGDDVSLSCGSGGNPSPVVKWNGQRSATIEFMDIQKSNEGQYTCRVTSTMVPSLGAAETRTVWKDINITVMYGATSPKIVYNYGINSEVIDPGNVLKVMEGKRPIEIACSDADGSPSPSYSWSGLKTSETGVLRFSNISRHDSGVYTCYAYNTLLPTIGAVRSEYSNRSLTINVLFPPDTEPFPDQNLNEGSSLDVTCNLTYYPTSAYQWTRSTDARVLSHSARLVISNMQRNATGVYVCTVEITMKPTGETPTTATISERMTVTVLHVPDSIKTLHCVVFSSTAVAIAWNPGFNGGYPQTFYVEYKKNQDNDWSFVTVIENKTSNKINSLLLEDLIAGSRYEVRMFSGNVLGNNSKTSTITFKTKEKNNDDNSDMMSSDSKIVPGAVGGVVGLALGIVVAVIIVCLFHYHRASRNAAQSSPKQEEFNMYEQNQATANTSEGSTGVQAHSSGSAQYEELSPTRKQGAEYTSLTVPEVTSDTRTDDGNFYEGVDNRLRRDLSKGLDKKDSHKSNMYDNLNMKV